MKVKQMLKRETDNIASSKAPSVWFKLTFISQNHTVLHYFPFRKIM